jgi:hypothetical protein
VCRWGDSKTGGKTLLRTSLGETISLVRCFSPVYCFQPDFSFHPQFQQNWSPVPPSLGYFVNNCNLASSSFANLVDGVVFTFDVLLEFQKIPGLWKLFIVHEIFVKCVFTFGFIFSHMLTFSWLQSFIYSVIKFTFHLLYIAYILSKKLQPN